MAVSREYLVKGWFSPSYFHPGALQAISFFLWNANHQKRGCFCWSRKILCGWARRSISRSDFWDDRRLHHAIHQGYSRHRTALCLPVQLSFLPHRRNVSPFGDRGVSMSQHLIWYLLKSIRKSFKVGLLSWKSVFSRKRWVKKPAEELRGVTPFHTLHVNGNSCESQAIQLTTAGQASDGWSVYVGYWGMFIWAPWFLSGNPGRSSSEMSSRFGRGRRGFLGIYCCFPCVA